MVLLLTALVLAGCPADCEDEPEPCDDDAGDDDAGDDDVVDDDSAGDDDTSSGDDDSAGDDDDSAGDDDTGLDCDVEIPIDLPTIQAAIDASQHGDTVCVSAGTYVETIDFSGRDVSVIGVEGPFGTVIDAQGSGPVVSIMQGETSAAVLAGFTITGGMADSGGGVRVHDASPTLRDLVIEGNEATISGGGIRLSSAALATEAVLSDVTVTQNTAADHGGGVSIWADDGGSITAQLTDIVVSGNTAEYGGGIAIDTYSYYDASAVQVTLLRVTAEQNLATASGGGLQLFCDSHGAIAADVTNLRLVDNWAGQDGGGMCAWAHGGSLDLTGDLWVITGNESGGDGGGLDFDLEDCEGHLALSHLWSAGNRAADGGGLSVYNSLGDTTLELSHAIFSGNEAAQDGGGVHLYNVPHVLTGGELRATIDASVLTANTAGSDGGAIATKALNNGSVDLSLANTILLGNAALDGGGVSTAGGPVVVTYTNAYANVPGDYAGMADPTGAGGNLSVDPELLDVAAADPLDWDLHIGLTSPLIDVGDPSTLDPDGSPSDIGAYGGPGAAQWDLDRDGYHEWWQPGEYDHGTYPGQGWDCDDRDEGVHPGNGC